MEPSTEATVRMLHADCRPTVEVAVPVGTPFVDLASRKEWLVDVLRQFGPRGCEMCLSGRDIIIRERFDDVINVALPRG
jgi:hypothetical protein